MATSKEHMAAVKAQARKGLREKPKLPVKVEFDAKMAQEAFESIGRHGPTSITDEVDPEESGSLGFSSKHENLVKWLTQVDPEALYELTLRRRGKGLLTDDIILKAEIALRMGASEDEAAKFAGTDPFVWRDMKRKYPNFAVAIDQWKADLTLWARIGLANLIKGGDAKAIMWYLERKQRDEFGPRLTVDQNKTVTHRIGPLDMSKVQALKKAIPIPYELDEPPAIDAETGKDVER